MNGMKKTGTDCIVEYLKSKYAPLSIITYGSYADGSQNENSDFDTLVISQNHEKFHDVSFVAGIQLDVFVYPCHYFDKAIDHEDLFKYLMEKWSWIQVNVVYLLKDKLLTI